MKLSAIITLGLLTLAGVSHASQEQLAASIKEARLETVRTADELKVTLDTLTALTKQKSGDLRPAYDAFAANLPKVKAAADWTAARVRWMESDGRKYFDTWQKTIDGISNEPLRKKAQKRFDTVRKSYDKVGTTMKSAGEKFQPFLVNLADIQKALSQDVTASGVKAIKGVVSNANWNHQFVESAIKDALKEMQKMEQALSPEAR